MKDNEIQLINDDFSINDLIALIRRRYQIIIITMSLFIIGGILFGLYAPKVYQSKSIITIGKIFDTQIQSNIELRRILELISFQSKEKIKIKFLQIDQNSIEIVSTSKSAQRAFDVNLEIIDTILHRHNIQYDNVVTPIDESIITLNEQINNFEKIFQPNNDSGNYLQAISILNDTKLNLEKSRVSLENKKNQFRKTRVIFKPKMGMLISPRLQHSIVYSFFLGMVFTVLLLYLIELFKSRLK